MSEPGDDAAVRDLKHAYGRLFNEHAADLGRIDALVAALRLALQRLEPFTKMTHPDMVEECKAIRAALKLAEGKEP